MRRTLRSIVPLTAVAALALPLAATGPAAAAPPPAALNAATATATSASATSLATAYTRSAADARISQFLTNRATTTRFGTAFTGTVIDAATGTTIWGLRPTTTYLPASNAKLFTALTTLTAFNPSTRFTTAVARGPAKDQVVVVGAGDPLLTSAQLDAMARTTATYLKNNKVSAPRVYVDDYRFPAPTLAPGWKSGYLIEDVTPVRALVRDNRDVSDTSVDAGTYFRGRLTVYGLTNAKFVGRYDAAASAPVITSVRSRTVGEMVNRMLLTSDNDVAEIVLRNASGVLGNGRTWTGARLSQNEAAAKQPVALGALYDGSGLSRSDRLSSSQLARLIRLGLDPARADLAPMRSSLSIPLAGRTGTLKTRFTTAPTSCAAGRIHAKTGTLNDVVALSGWTTGTDGRVKVFSFVVNGRQATTELKKNIDILAATVTGCY